MSSKARHRRLFMALLLWSLFQQVFVFFAQLWDEIIKMIG